MGRDALKLILVEEKALEKVIFDLLNEYSSAKDEYVLEHAKEIVKELTWPTL